MSLADEAGKIVKFFGARAFSFLIEEAGMFLLVDVAGMYNLIAKLILAVFVIVSNYIFSKLFIFRNQSKEGREEKE